MLATMLVLMLVGCSGGEVYRQSIIDRFDTVITISGEMSREDFDEMFRYADERLEHYHRLYDGFNEYDGVVNIATLNRTAGNAPVEVSSELMELLVYSKEMYELTDGRLNIAFGTVLQLWSDARDYALQNPTDAQIPDIESLQSAANHCDIDDLVLDLQDGTVYYADPMLRLDVGGIAKGYSAQMIANALHSAGYEDVLLALGGNITAVGSDEGRSWTAGIEDPLGTSPEPVETLELNGGDSLVVSGDYIRYFTVTDGVNSTRYGHIIDTKTLMPTEYYLSVAVRTHHAGLADALSTALYTMTPNEALELVEGMPSVEVMLIDKDNVITYSSGFLRE